MKTEWEKKLCDCFWISVFAWTRNINNWQKNYALKYVLRETLCSILYNYFVLYVNTVYVHYAEYGYARY